MAEETPGAEGGAPDGDLPVEEGGGAESWETFNGVDAYGQEVSGLSPVEALLRCSPPCTIDELLDEESLVQEFRFGSPQLLDRLCSPESLRALVRYVTREPPADVPEACRCRRPYIASELLASGAERLCEALAQPEEGRELLAEFWSFLDTPELGLAAPALAGYFCSAAVGFLSVRPLDVADFLRSRGPQELLESLLGLLELRCFAELTALLLAAEAPGHLVFPPAGLVRQLVARLSGTGPAQEHAAFLLDHLLAKACAGDLCYGAELLRQFAEPELVATLADQVLAGSDAAAAVLSCAVTHLHGMQQHPLLPVRSPELRAPCDPRAAGPRAQPERPSAPLGDLDPDAAPEAGAERDPAHAELAAPSEADGAENAPGLAGPEHRNAAGAEFVAQLCAHLPRLCQALEAAATKRAEAAKEAWLERKGADALREAIVLLLKVGGDGAAFDAGPLTASLGELGRNGSEEGQELQSILHRHSWTQSAPAVPHTIRDLQDLLRDLRSAAQRARASPAQPSGGQTAGMVVEILCIITLLVQTGRDFVFEALLAAEALPRCLEVLLASPGSSMLHSAVRAVFHEVLRSREQASPLVLALLQAAPLMRRVVEEQRPTAKLEEASLSDRCRQADRGHVAPLRCICADLSSFAPEDPEVLSALQSLEGWLETVMPGIWAAEDARREPLGGEHPESTAGSNSMVHFDCMVAMHGAMAEQSDEVELSLEDLRDINEDLGTEPTVLDRVACGAPDGPGAPERDSEEEFDAEMLCRASRQISDLVETRRRAKARAEEMQRALGALDAPAAEEAAKGQPPPLDEAFAQTQQKLESPDTLDVECV